jgi:phenylacetate-CoA ligase
MTFGMHIGAFAIYDAVSQWLGCTAVTTSGGTVTPSTRQLEIADELGTTVFVGFSEYLVHLAGVMAERGFDPREALPSIRSFSVAGNPASVEKAWGRPAYDFFGASEYGMIGSQLPGETGLRIWDDVAFVEIIDPDTGEPIEEPDVLGSLVITSLIRTTSPVVRFDTHDLTCWLELPHRDGSADSHIDHHRGRSDGMMRIKGVNVWPEACAELVSTLPLLNGQYYCVLSNEDGKDSFKLLAEAREAGVDRDAAATALSNAFKRTFEVSIDVEVVDAAALTPLTGYGIENKIRRFEDRRGPVGGSS